jgi:hypothetical protein
VRLHQTIMMASGLALACANAKTTPVVLSPEGSRVRISDGPKLDGCEYLGDFVGGTSPRQVPGVWARNQVRNLAAEHGATDVVIDDHTRSGVVGSAYRCP